MYFGIDPLSVGDYTPYEIRLVGKQTQEAQTKTFENAIITAWHTEAFARQKHLIKINKLLKDIRRPKSNGLNKSDYILKMMAKEKGVEI